MDASPLFDEEEGFAPRVPLARPSAGAVALEDAPDPQEMIEAPPSPPGKDYPVRPPLREDLDAQLGIGEVLVARLDDELGPWKELNEGGVRYAVHITNDDVGGDSPGNEDIEARVGRAYEGEIPESRLKATSGRRFSPGDQQCIHGCPVLSPTRGAVKAAPSGIGSRPMRAIRPPRELFEFSRPLIEAGKACFLVGGAVRDYLLGREVSDFDAASDALPDEVARLYKRVIPTGIKHGTVTVLFKGLEIEVTTFRTESGYADGRHPDKVLFASSIEEDLSRRDFTINAMAFDLADKSLLDPHGGRADLAARLVRAVGDPLERFREDGLRPLRALRFAAQLGFEIEAATLDAIGPSINRFRLVSNERVREELQKMLLAEQPSRGLRLLEMTGLLAEISPELAACRGVDQRGCISMTSSTTCMRASMRPRASWRCVWQPFCTI